jgi:ribulose-phosphate 3-epimerase
MQRIVPSILSADFARLGEQVEATLQAGARRIHVDVMDGQFVPNITFGLPIVQALRPLADRYNAQLDVHLMIVQPERYLAPFREAGADIISVHVEASPHLHRSVQVMRELGAQPGVAINPATSLTAIEEILPELNMVLVMTVNPGFGGQQLIPSSLSKIARLKRMLAERGLAHVAIEIDGGASVQTLPQLAQAGATHFVAGSSVFGGPIARNMQALHAALEAAA